MPAPDPDRRPARVSWPVPVLGLLGAAGLVLGWRYAVLPWYAGAVLAGLAVVGLVTWRGWRRWVHLVAVLLVAGLVAVPTLLRPGSGADGLIEVVDPRVSVAEDVLVTLEWQEQVSTLTAWSRPGGQQLWTRSEDAGTPTDSRYPLPLVVGDRVLVGDLHPQNQVDGWPSLGALDLATGEQLWSSEVTGRVLGHHDGVLVVATPEHTMEHLGPGTLRGVDAETGRVLWTEQGVLPTGGLPMVATDSDATGWGGHLPEVGDLPLLAVRPVSAEGTGPGAMLVDPGTGAVQAEVPAAAEDGVLLLGEQVVVVHSGSGVRHLQAYDRDGQRLWDTEVDTDAPDLNGLDLVPGGAVMTAGERVLLDDATAVLDLTTGEVLPSPVRAVPGSDDDILVGSHYAVTTAVTDTGYFTVLDLASGQVQTVPPELGGSDRPDAFYGGEDGVLLYTDVLERPFGRTECRVRALAMGTMAITEHRLGECTEPATVRFWGEVPVAESADGWRVLGTA